MSNNQNTFTLRINEAEPFEAGAVFAALLASPPGAYPSEAPYSDMVALIHSGLAARASWDPDWAKTPQLIKPIYAFNQDKMRTRRVITLHNRINERLKAAHAAVYYLKHLEGTLPPTIVGKGKKKLTLTAIIKHIQSVQPNTDIYNFSKRIWSISLPVIHLCTALAAHIHQLESQMPPEATSTRKAQLALSHLLFEPERLRDIVEMSDRHADLLLKSGANINADKLIRVHVV